MHRFFELLKIVGKQQTGQGLISLVIRYELILMRFMFAHLLGRSTSAVIEEQKYTRMKGLVNTVNGHTRSKETGEKGTAIPKKERQTRSPEKKRKDSKERIEEYD